MAQIDAFFKLMNDEGASDLHMMAGQQPVLRIRGDGAMAHVHVDHAFGARLQGHHRKRTGVGKQVQKPFAGHPGHQSLAVLPLVKKQAGIKSFLQRYQEVKSVFLYSQTARCSRAAQ